MTGDHRTVNEKTGSNEQRFKMGGTLDNGIYLPDQGERNCYNGLKNNWDTLDNLIETVQALSSAGLTREIVNSLPTDNIKTNVIYMLRNSQQSGDLYDEYMYINNAWEPIGTSATEMDNYYTKSETNALPAVASGITASKVTGYDTHVANTDVHVTTAEKTVWNGKQNALDTAQTAAVNSGVNATKVTGYDTHVSNTDIHVTASDKTAWNAKQDGLSQTQLNAVNSGVTDTKVTGYDTHVGDSSAHVSSSDRTAWNGKQDALSQTQLDNIAAVPDKANSADLATVATTGDYGDLLNAPTIPTVNNATLTIQKNGTDVATFTANASSNVTANLSIPTDTSDLTNGAGFLTQHNPIDNELSVSSENAVQNKVVTTALNGKAASSHTHAAGDINTGTFNIARIPDLDASKITSGTIDIARLPKGSLERLVKVADQAARYALTTDDVQLGDTVQQLDTGVMYVVTDETKLDSADGYTEFTAGSATSVPWSGVTGKPSTFTPSSHTHGNITNDGKVGTAANKPLITGTGGAVQAGSFGTLANTFCEGNDSRLSDARTPVAHTHTKSDVTDLLNSNFIPLANNSYDLGSSSYQWNKVYSKEYYYNGVAWGLDKENTWTAWQTLEHTTEALIRLKRSNLQIGDPIPASQQTIGTIPFAGKNNLNLGLIACRDNTNGDTYLTFTIRQRYDSNGRANNGTQYESRIDLGVDSSHNLYLRPNTNGNIDLGTSTNKWKTLNGVNPGALSLPGAFESINSQIKDPNGQLNNIDLNGGNNTWVSDVDCYLYFYIPNNKFTWIRIFWPASLVRCGQTFVPVPNESSDYSGFIPAPANTTVVIQIKGTQAPVFRRSACLGNV